MSFLFELMREVFQCELLLSKLIKFQGLLNSNLLLLQVRTVFRDNAINKAI